MSTYQTQAQINAVVQGFQSCTTDKAEFKHRDHLTVAVAYLRELTLEQSLDKMREALLRFVDHHKVDRQKYNETITVFWFQMVAAAMTTMPANVTVVEQCNRVLESFSNADLVLDYYTRDLLFSERARKEFVEPDLKDWRDAQPANSYTSISS
jgi:hypothetical protein